MEEPQHEPGESLEAFILRMEAYQAAQKVKDQEASIERIKARYTRGNDDLDYLMTELKEATTADARKAWVDKQLAKSRPSSRPARMGMAVTGGNMIHKDDVPWWEAPIPRKKHKCSVQSSGWTGDHGLTQVWRCACGAIALDGKAIWVDRNTRTSETGLAAGIVDKATEGLKKPKNKRWSITFRNPK